jgi:hypothetical protein
MYKIKKERGKRKNAKYSKQTKVKRWKIKISCGGRR